MTPPDTIISRLYGTTAGGAESATYSACTPLGPVRRSVGLFGDALAVKIPYDGIAGDWDLTKELKLRIGTKQGVIEDLRTLGGYYLRQRRQVDWGEDPDNPGTFRFHGIELLMTTLPGVLRDGRGGMLTEGTLNATSDTGRVDTAGAGYRTTQQLVDLCLDALGVAHDPCPSAINTPADGTTTIDAPGPLDWGLTRALPELDELLARVGWAATMVNDGSKIVVHRLRRAGESITLPTIITDNAEPYSLETAAGVRPAEVVVTSGRTRTTIITDRSIGGTSALEWVAFDSRTGLWMNNTEWTTEYPSEDGPGDLTVFQAGPGGTERTAEDMRAFGRMFTAVRLHEDDRPAAASFVMPAEGITTGAGVVFSKTPAVAIGRYVVDQGAGQFVNEPTDSTTIRLDKVQAIPGEGVFVLPTDVTWVRMDPGPTGSFADAAALASDDLAVVFAHEADTGDWEHDYYASGWKATAGTGQVGVTQMNSSELAAAMDDPDVVKVEAPWLRRLLLWPEGDINPTTLNDTELGTVANQLALTRIGRASLTGGTIELEGLRAVEPGDADGAVSAVSWDLSRMRTVVEINSHETPSGYFDGLEAQARRSVSAGLGRFSLPGSSAAANAVRSGSTPGDQTAGAASAGGTATPESQPGVRGRDKAVAGRPEQKQADAGGAKGVATRAEVSERYVEIIDWSAVAPNRWRYQWAEVAWNGTSWAQVVGGASDSTHGYAYNGIEAGNTGAGVEGNGVNVDNLPGTYAMQPIGTGSVVLLRGPFTDGSGTEVYWFTAVNAVDGDCGGGS